MAWEILKSAVVEVIKANGNNEINGDILQETLLSIINNLGENSYFTGVAIPATVPGDPDGNVFYLASTVGTYSNFSALTVASGEIAILTNKTGSWTKQVLSITLSDGLVTSAKLADDSVNTSKIIDSAITSDKLADDSVTDEKISASTNYKQKFDFSEDEKLEIADSDGNVAFEINNTEVLYFEKFTQAKLIELLSALFYQYQGESFEIADDEGNVTFKVDSTGLNYFGKMTESNVLALIYRYFGILSEITDDLEICDDEGNVTARIAKTAGLEYYGKLTKADVTVITVPKGQFQADLNQIIVYGQSLSVGGSFSSQVDFYDSKTFTGGVLTNYDPDTAGAADAYFGSALIDLPKNGSEGGQGKGIAKIWKELLRDENKIPIASQDTTFVVNSAGAGGLSWSQCSDVNGDYYRRLLESVSRGKDFAIAQGKTYNVPVLAYLQGENSADKDDSITEFYNKLDTLFTSLNTDIKAITGQTNDVQFINYQIASFPNNSPATVNVPLAQLKISLEKTNVHFGTAMYQYDYADSLHVTSTSYRMVGGLMGVVAKRAVTDQTKMLPISPIIWKTQVNSAGTSWILQMKMNVPVSPLVFDTTVDSKYTVAPTNYGFSILNGSTEIIQSVSILRGDTLNIVCNQNPVGKTLTYAIQGVYSGGNLRDSQGNTLTISCEGVNQPLHNWCPIFQQVI